MEHLEPSLSTSHSVTSSASSAGSPIFAAIDDPDIRRALHRKARAMLGNDADAEECVQDALFLASRNAHRFEDRSAPKTWLTTIVINCCRMYVRRVARHRGPRFDAFETPTLDPAASDPESVMVASEIAAGVARVLERGAPEDVRIFEECVLGAMPVQEFSRNHQFTESMVKTRLYRLRQRVAAELEGSSSRPRPRSTRPSERRDAALAG